MRRENKQRSLATAGRQRGAGGPGVPWNKTTNKPQPGYSYTQTVTTEWRLLDFNGQAAGG